MVRVDRDRVEADPQVPLAQGRDHRVGFLLSGAPILLRGLEFPGEESHGVHGPSRARATPVIVALLEGGANGKVGRVHFYVKRAVRLDNEQLESLCDELLCLNEGALCLRRPHQALRLLALRFALGHL